MTQGIGLTMGLTLPLFLLAWVAMMIAMMFPTAAPMILMFGRVAAGKQERAQPFVGGIREAVEQPVEIVVVPAHKCHVHGTSCRQ